MSPSSSFLSHRQLSSLKAVVNALLPPKPLDGGGDDDGLFPHDISNDPVYISALEETLATKLYPDEYIQMKMLLTLLSTALGSSLSFTSFRGSFSSAPLQVRIQALHQLQHSRWTVQRQIYQSLKRLICGLAFSFVDDEGNNPFWDSMGYPGPPASTEKDDVPDDFDPSALLKINQDTILDYDVVIVGSGAGGGVAAAVLSQAGFDVLVLEKGPYLKPSEITSLECHALDQMYEKHSLLTTQDGNIMILAGSTLGGGTTINWACCLPLPTSVQHEWEQQVPQFDSSSFLKSLECVQERLGCTFTEHVTHNTTNQFMQKGCRVMGYGCETTGQNLRDTSQDSAGYTCFGDAQRNKQSGLVTYLQDAVASGAHIIDNCTVHRVLHKVDKRSGQRRAVGVVATVGAHKLQVNAKKCVIISAGSINSPCLLQRSGFRNTHIGRHLHLHPVTPAFGFMDQEVHAYRGAPMTTVCNDFFTPGSGAKLECPSVHTGITAAAVPYQNPSHFCQMMRKFIYGVPLIVLQRDTSEGRVHVGRFHGKPVIDYVVNEEDQKSMIRSLKSAIQILIGCGAREVSSCHRDDPGLQLDKALETEVAIRKSAWVQDYLQSAEQRGMGIHEMGVFSAHQMSSCRMSASPKEGVVDENGETWECNDLFVMDASIFPTASGANPMLTTLTLSHMLSTRLASRLKDEGVERKRQTASHGRTSLLSWTVAGAVVVASVAYAKHWRR